MIDEDSLSLQAFTATGSKRKRPPNNDNTNTNQQSAPRRRLDSSDDEDSDSDDASPPRKNNTSSSTNQSNKTTEDDGSDSDAAPRRRNVDSDDDDDGSDSDASPPRRGATASSTSSSSSSSSSTLSGLVSAEEFQKNHEKQQKKKQKELKRIEAARKKAGHGNDHNKVIHRDGQGNIIDIKATKIEREIAKKKEEKLWTSGKAQREKLMQQFEHMQDMAEAPFAQYSNNANSSRDDKLKSRSRVDDPMAQFDLKKDDEDDSSSSSSSSRKKKLYRGPPAPSNRFNVLPGYRWDGVDRGNGFEAKVIESLRRNGKMR